MNQNLTIRAPGDGKRSNPPLLNTAVLTGSNAPGRARATFRELILLDDCGCVRRTTATKLNAQLLIGSEVIGSPSVIVGYIDNPKRKFIDPTWDNAARRDWLYEIGRDEAFWAAQPQEEEEAIARLFAWRT